MNNLANRQSIGEWMKEYGIDSKRAVLWPMEPTLAANILEETEVRDIVGLSPRGYPLPKSQTEALKVEDKFTHDYEGTDFDLEYGWAIADDIKTTIEPLIDPENNLHQYEYPDEQERDEVLDAAFLQLTETSDRLLNNEDATAVYNLESVSRYELPDLAEDVSQNQINYGKRIASWLETHGFDAEVIEEPDYSRNVHVIGRR